MDIKHIFVKASLEASISLSDLKHPENHKRGASIRILVTDSSNYDAFDWEKGKNYRPSVFNGRQESDSALPEKLDYSSFSTRMT